MRNVTHKIETLRTATASGRIAMHPETVLRLKANDVPKKDVLGVAKTAGILAAKKTWDLLPYCHPLPIDGIDVDFTIGEGEVSVQASVTAIWKTGVEMEALTAVSVALLTIYDMVKPIDKEMTIGEIVLVEKRGGKSSFHDSIPAGFKVAVIVTSDGTAALTREDKSGKAIVERLASYGVSHPDYVILPDDRERIVLTLRRFASEGYHMLVTTGGTGLGPRDVTVEATREIIDREIPGISETMRRFGQARTPYAMLSRGLAGLCGKTLIVNLPGSSRGVEESMDALFPALFHAYPMMTGGGH